MAQAGWQGRQLPIFWQISISELPETRAFKLTSASKDRNLRLFTLKIKNDPRPSLAYLSTEVSESDHFIRAGLNPAGKASPSAYCKAGSPTSGGLFL